MAGKSGKAGGKARAGGKTSAGEGCCIINGNKVLRSASSKC